MLKLQDKLFKKIAILYGVIFSLFFGGSYLLFSLFLETKEVLELLGSIFVLFLLLSALFFFYLRSFLKKIEEDVETIIDYTQKLNDKKYESEIKIAHYMEFLQLSVLLKNIAKRLRQREKKSKK